MRQLALLLLLALAGCARKLPGPAECRAHALASLGVPLDVPAVVLEQEPRLARRAEETTRQCLTTPWDYELLACLQSGLAGQYCLNRFERRRLLRSARVE